MILSQQISPMFWLFFLWCFLEKIDAVVHSNSRSFVKNYKYSEPNFTIHKVSLTQKGYIQFLKYVAKVPTLTEYTFCIWVKSNNFTHNQPIFSYSRHEEERLIRVWISPMGTELNLEIMNRLIFSVPVNMMENHWYHVCQSWSGHQAIWELYINGKLKSSGFALKLKGVPIKGDGDIVVGQEYTDFDKGLDDGIEGDVFGFNFVLSATSNSLKYALKTINHPLRRHYEEERIRPQFHAGTPLNIYEPSYQFESGAVRPTDVNYDREYLEKPPDTDVPHDKKSRGLMSLFTDVYNFFGPETQQERRVIFSDRQVERKILNEVDDIQKSLGLLLVELSFSCEYKKGAPLSGKGVIINWAKTAVRVYGGAILKRIPPFCV